jgi:hypothetical protein
MDGSNYKAPLTVASIILFTFCYVGYESFKPTYQISTVSIPSHRQLTTDGFRTEACEISAIRSHKTVCCSDMDRPVMGGIDLVELTKGLLKEIPSSRRLAVSLDDFDVGEFLTGDKLPAVASPTEEVETLSEPVEEPEVEIPADAVETETPASENGNRIPVLGSEEFSGYLPTSFGLYRFLFVSAENRDVFLEDPWKYVPAYGGFDAEGIALEDKAHDDGYVSKLGPLTDISSWEIIDDRLFFFGSLKNKNMFKAEVNAISLGDETWKKYYGSDTVMDGYLNTNCFQRTTYEQLASGEVYIESAGIEDGGSPKKGGSAGTSKSSTSQNVVYVNEAKSLIDLAQDVWNAQTKEEVMDMRTGREFSLSFLYSDKVNQ